MEWRGPDGVQRFFATGAEGVPDTEITITDERVCGSVVVQEGVFGDTRTGSLVTPGDQVIPAPRRSLEAPCADFFEVEGGRIKSELYYDQVELLAQLGLMPAPAAAAS